MKEKFAFLSLFITVLLFGVLNGGGLYEEIVVAPVWSASPPTSFALIQEPGGLSLTSFWIPFHISANIFLVIALVLNWQNIKQRHYLLAVLGLYIVIRAATFAYFAPEIIAFQNIPPEGPFSPELAERAELWSTLSRFRGIGEIAINILLLLAISRQGKEISKRHKGKTGINGLPL
ncbi:hypothetical protein KZ483_05455 [Paenibacillus sp. sptzw28]|uniref:hypothetical protein n=1 Tax=Paenibacillus sp. sptzw28 TaxID=715179 RepID=UPI001C6E2889|nr:hypothetical protein [Paenibacillus sp. sptzw28]QYR22425.1 hypothetical protein KZ483_05455 [Paenibacillus sp. sptzw28]